MVGSGRSRGVFVSAIWVEKRWCVADGSSRVDTRKNEGFGLSACSPNKNKMLNPNVDVMSNMRSVEERMKHLLGSFLLHVCI